MRALPLAALALGVLLLAPPVQAALPDAPLSLGPDRQVVDDPTGMLVWCQAMECSPVYGVMSLACEAAWAWPACPPEMLAALAGCIQEGQEGWFCLPSAIATLHACIQQELAWGCLPGGHPVLLLVVMAQFGVHRVLVLEFESESALQAFLAASQAEAAKLPDGTPDAPALCAPPAGFAAYLAGGYPGQTAAWGLAWLPRGAAHDSLHADLALAQTAARAVMAELLPCPP